MERNTTVRTLWFALSIGTMRILKEEVRRRNSTFSSVM
jgi:hypothetical protein